MRIFRFFYITLTLCCSSFDFRMRTGRRKSMNCLRSTNPTETEFSSTCCMNPCSHGMLTHGAMLRENREFPLRSNDGLIETKILRMRLCELDPDSRVLSKDPLLLSWTLMFVCRRRTRRVVELKSCPQYFTWGQGWTLLLDRMLFPVWAHWITFRRYDYIFDTLAILNMYKLSTYS